MIEIGRKPALNLVTIRVRGELEGDDYDKMIPEVETAIEESGGALRAVVILDNVKNWDLRALWKDLKFDARHFNDFQRIAVLGDTKLEEWGTKASALVTGAKVRYFTIDEYDAAQEWAVAD